MRELRQSTAFTHKAGPFVDTSGAVVTSLDIDRADVLLSKNAGAFTQKNDTTANAAYDAVGHYLITCDATDSNTLGHLRMVIVETGALPVTEDFMVLSAYEWDRKYTAQGQALGGVASYGTAQAATGTTIQLASAEVYADNTPIGMTVAAFGSTQGYWQARVVTDYDLATDTVTVDDWTVTPSGTISYVVYPSAPGSLTNPVPASLGTGAITNSTFAAGAIDDTAIAPAALPSSKFDEADPVPVNVVEVNDVVVTGDGQPGTEWGP